VISSRSFLINVADLDLYLKVASVNKGQPYPNK